MNGAPVYPRRTLLLVVCPSRRRREALLGRALDAPVVLDDERIVSGVGAVANCWLSPEAGRQARQLVLDMRLDGRPTAWLHSHLPDPAALDEAFALARARGYGVEALLVDPEREHHRDCAEVIAWHERAAAFEEALAERDVDVVHVSPRSTSNRIEFVDGPGERFDIVGDVHGCLDELLELLARLGYEHDGSAWRAPPGRRLLFVGDLVSRGPCTLGTVRLAARLVDDGVATIAALGNQDWQLYRTVVLGEQRTWSSQQSVAAELLAEDDPWGAATALEADLRALFDDAPAYTVWDEGRLVVSHAALRRGQLGAGWVKGRDCSVSNTAMYGEPTDERAFGSGYALQGYEWTRRWERSRLVVIGHDVVGRTPYLMGEGANVWAVDTGCAFGGALTALRYPEEECVVVPARRRYWGARFEPNPRIEIARTGSTRTRFGRPAPKAGIRPDGTVSESDDEMDPPVDAIWQEGFTDLIAAMP